MALLIAGVCLFMTVASPASAKTAGYCLECHTHPFLQTLHQDWSRSSLEDRSVYSMKLGACPGLRSFFEETFFTESRIVKLNRILRAIEQEGWMTDRLKKEVAASAASLSDLKGEEKVSAQPFSKEASALRASLQKVYEQSLNARNESSRRWLIGVGGLSLLGLLILIGLGIWKLGHMEKTLLVPFLIGGVFLITACTSSPTEPRKKSPGQERLEQSLSLATRVTRQMDETFYQSCLLAEMSREWSRIEPAAAEKGFRLAWRMSLAAREKADQILPLKEFVSRWPDPAKAAQEEIQFDTVLDLHDELRNAEGRTWSLRAVAEEWVRVNPKEGRSALEFVTKEALAIRDPEPRSRELKAIAEVWSGMKEVRSLEIARSIADPFLKAMALTHAALSLNHKGRGEALLQEAWGVAEAVLAPSPRSEAMIQIAATAAQLFPQKKNGWLDRTLLQIQDLKGDHLKAFALQELVFRWSRLDMEQAKRLAMEIPVAYPEERAYAMIHLAKSRKIERTQALTLLQEASAEMLKISDPFEASKVRGLIGKELAQLDPREALQVLSRIEDPLYRSEILGALALQLSKKDRKGALGLAERIPLEPIRIKISVDLVRQGMDGDRERLEALCQETLSSARSIADPYTQASILIELSKRWNRIERGQESALLEMALASAERISSPWKKAEIIEDLAAAWKGSDRAGAQALLDRIDPSILLVRKSLDEVRQWATVDPEKAKRLAEAIPSPFPLERAMAYREVAGNLKKVEPRFAFDLLERSIGQLLTLPEGHKGRKLLFSLVADAARLDPEKTFQKIRQVSELETRDILFKEAGLLWAQENFPFAMKAVQEVSEGSLRLILYQKMADTAARRPFPSMKSGPGATGFLLFSQWGQGREKTKRDESQAVPYYEKVLQEIEKLKDAQERSALLSGLAAEWASIDEEKAVRITGEISSEFPESLSYGLLQIGTQLKRWNRKEAEAVFQKAVSTAAGIQDQKLKGRRLLDIGQQWQGMNKEKAIEVLKMAEAEARKDIASRGRGETLLTKILIVRSAFGPPDPLTIFEKTDSPFVRASVLLEQAKIESKAAEEDIKVLEKALQYSQKAKHYRLMSEVALAWHALAPEKGLEICNQIESSELQVKTLCRMVRENISLKKEERKGLLERAAHETALIPGLTEKIKALKEIAEAGRIVDQEQAKAVYRRACRMVEKASF